MTHEVNESQFERIFQEMLDLQKSVRSYRAGNTQLIEALMYMVSQHFRHDGLFDGQPRLMHNHVSADEAAIQVLCNAGMAKQDLGGWFLLWGELEKRKKPETWADAVNGLKHATPEEKARLLALDDETE